MTTEEMTTEEILIPLTVSTNQEAFDAICRHLAQMTEQSATDSGSCVYRRVDGNRCAIGAVITDENYDFRMEGASILDLTRAGWCRWGDKTLWGKDPYVVKIVTSISSYLLGDLQEQHDMASNWRDDMGYPLGRFDGWDRVKDVGDAYNLNLSVLDELKVL